MLYKSGQCHIGKHLTLFICNSDSDAFSAAGDGVVPLSKQVWILLCFFQCFLWLYVAELTSLL